MQYFYNQRKFFLLSIMCAYPLCASDDSWVKKGFLLTKHEKDTRAKEEFNYLIGSKPEKIYPRLIGLTTSSDFSSIINVSPLILTSREIFKFEPNALVNFIQPDNSNKPIQKGPFIESKQTVPEIPSLNIDGIDKIIKSAGSKTTFANERNNIEINGKILKEIVDTCSREEIQSKSTWNSVKNFFYTEKIENTKLYQTLNQSLSNTQQTAINHLIQTDKSNKLIYPQILLLINNKADINLQNNSGNTLTHLYFDDWHNHDNQRHALIGKTSTDQRCGGECYPTLEKLSDIQKENGIEFSDLKKEIDGCQYVIFNALKIFLQQKANLAIQNKDGNTPLHMKYALSNLEPEKIYDLLNENKQISILNIPNNKGITPFILLTSRLPFDYMLSKAAKHLFRLNNPNKYTRIQDKNDNNVLHYIAKNKKLTFNEIKELYQRWPDTLCAKNKKEKSALDMLCYDLSPDERENLAKELDLENNSLANITDEHGNTFLHRKFNNLYNDKHLTELLENPKNRAQLSVKNNYGQTPLHLLIKEYNFAQTSFGSNTSCGPQKKNHSQIKQFIKNHVSQELLDLQDNKGNSVFYTLFDNQSLDDDNTQVMKWINKFLAKNPNLALKNAKGNTPMHRLICFIIQKYYSEIKDDEILYERKNNKKETIKIPDLSSSLTMKNNRKETVLEYVFNKMHRWSEKKSAKKLIDLLSQLKNQQDNDRDFKEFIKKYQEYIYSSSYLAPWMYEYKGFLTKRINIFNKAKTAYGHKVLANKNDENAFIDMEPKFLIDRLRETVAYVDRKHRKYSSKAAYFLWIMKHETESMLKKNYISEKYLVKKSNQNRFIIPIDLIKKLALQYIAPCHLTINLEKIINTFASQKTFTREDIKNLKESAQEFLELQSTHKSKKR